MIYTARAKRFEIYRNDNLPYLTMGQVKAKTGCDIVFNGTWYKNSPVRPVGNFTVNGKVLSNQYHECLGYGWNGGELPTMAWYGAADKDNFICATPLIHNGEKVTLNYPSEVAGIRGRTAMGQKTNGEWAFLCTSDHNGAMTMEALQAKMFDLGCVSAISYDGGGSCEMITPGGSVTTTRTIYNFVCVWIDDGEEVPEDVEETATTYLHGIDVSEHQGIIDWGKAENEIDFAMIRAGTGTRLDYQFKRNISECNRIGIPCGVYWYSLSINEEEAKVSAKMLLDAIKSYKVEYPVVYDFERYSVRKAKERRGVTFTRDLATKVCHAFCAVTEAAGYYTMVYTNDGFIREYYDDTIADKYDLWVPTYPTVIPAKLDNPPRACGMWQYSDKGSITGIKGRVDMNVAYRDYAEIIIAAGLNGLAITEKPEPIIPVSAEPAAAQKLIAAGWGDVLIAMADKI